MREYFFSFRGHNSFFASITLFIQRPTEEFLSKDETSRVMLSIRKKSIEFLLDIDLLRFVFNFFKIIWRVLDCVIDCKHT